MTTKKAIRTYEHMFIVSLKFFFAGFSTQRKTVDLTSKARVNLSVLDDHELTLSLGNALSLKIPSGKVNKTLLA